MLRSSSLVIICQLDGFTFRVISNVAMLVNRTASTRALRVREDFRCVKLQDERRNRVSRLRDLRSDVQEGEKHKRQKKAEKTKYNDNCRNKIARILAADARTGTYPSESTI